LISKGFLDFFGLGAASPAVQLAVLTVIASAAIAVVGIAIHQTFYKQPVVKKSLVRKTLKKKATDLQRNANVSSAAVSFPKPSNPPEPSVSSSNQNLSQPNDTPAEQKPGQNPDPVNSPAQQGVPASSPLSKTEVSDTEELVDLIVGPDQAGQAESFQTETPVAPMPGADALSQSFQIAPLGSLVSTSKVANEANINKKRTSLSISDQNNSQKTETPAFSLETKMDVYSDNGKLITEGEIPAPTARGTKSDEDSDWESDLMQVTLPAGTPDNQNQYSVDLLDSRETDKFIFNIVASSAIVTTPSAPLVAANQKLFVLDVAVLNLDIAQNASTIFNCTDKAIAEKIYKYSCSDKKWWELSIEEPGKVTPTLKPELIR